MASFPCGKCGEECDGNRNIGCDSCDRWFHQKCELLNNHQFAFLHKTDLPYVCSFCCMDSSGNFDFLSGLQRLSQHSLTKDAAKLESIFIRSLATKFQFSPATGPFIKDNVASGLMGPKSDYLAVETTGDGNCLFNSLSLAIQNNELLATELRYRTCIEMISNRDYYMHLHDSDNLSFVSDTFEESIANCAKNYSFSSPITMQAAATVIGKAIRSFYPAVNGIFDSSIGILNRTFKPRNSSSEKNPVCILWSSVRPFLGTGTWTPNHFVLLQPQGTATCILDESDFPPLPTTPTARHMQSSTPLLSERRDDEDPPSVNFDLLDSRSSLQELLPGNETKPNFNLIDSDSSLQHLLPDSTIGTDEEQALVNAIKTAFPSSQHILCTRHLKENAQRNLLIQNVPEKTRSQIISAIFGQNGLIYSESRVEYLELEEEILDKFGHLEIRYLSEKLLPTLKEKVFLPHLNNPIIPPDWKNNNCESMNHKIKLLGNWRVSKIPELIERLLNIHESQLLEIRGALHGRGNLELSDRAKILRVTHAFWLEMNNDRRKKLFNKFIKFTPRSNTVESSDGQLQIPAAARLAKKPGQIKRVRNVKTQSMNKRPKI